MFREEKKELFCFFCDFPRKRRSSVRPVARFASVTRRGAPTRILIRVYNISAHEPKLKSAKLGAGPVNLCITLRAVLLPSSVSLALILRFWICLQYLDNHSKTVLSPYYTVKREYLNFRCNKVKLLV